MALSRKTTAAMLILVSLVSYLYKIQIASLFWTGFYLKALKRTSDTKKKARLYSFLGEWDKRVEIDEENGFMEGAFDYTYTYSKDEKLPPVDELLNFLDGIDALSNAGNPEKALAYMGKYDPTTHLEKATKQRYMELLTQQQSLIHDQQEYLELALRQVEKMKFADDVDPLIYIRYSSYIIMGQLCHLIYLWHQQKERRMRRVFFSIVFLFTSVLYWISGTTRLTRSLTASTLVSFGEDFFLTTSEAAHRPSSHLERARQLFVKYPYHYDDLVTNQVLGLMTHIFWKELRRCNYPRPDNSNDFQYCKSAYLVGQTIADMLDADQSAKDSLENSFWNQEILMAIQEHVEQISSDSFFGWYTWLLNGGSTIDSVELDSEYIRNSLDQWFDEITQDESEQKEQRLYDMEEAEYIAFGNEL